MTDIVERLREDLDIHAEYTLTGDDIREAADLIETLRAAVKRLSENEQWLLEDMAALMQPQVEPAYWLSARGDLFSSSAIADMHGAAKPYTPLYTQAPQLGETP